MASGLGMRLAGGGGCLGTLFSYCMYTHAYKNIDGNSKYLAEHTVQPIVAQVKDKRIKGKKEKKKKDEKKEKEKKNGKIHRYLS